MRFLRVLLPVLILGILTLAPVSVQAATSTFLGPIIPEQCHCPGSAPDFGCVLQVIENLMNFAISIGVVIFVLVSAYAGLLWMFSPMNPHNRELGRSILLNAVIGLLFALSAWLLVDFIMKTLYNDGSFGPWNQILGDGDQCLAVHESPAGQSPGTGTGVTGTTGGTAGPADGRFSYQSGVESQNSARSTALVSLLNCMANKVPGNVGQISALTDSYVGTNTQLINHCADVGHEGDPRCVHTVGSCHYGGDTHSGKSYAADFGDEQNRTVLIQAANECGAQRAAFENGNHVHVSAPGASCN